MTQKMKLRLSTTSDSDAGQPAINSGRSADILNGTVSGISTIHTASSLMNTRERFHAESSENGVSQELSHSRSINISTLEFPAESAGKLEHKGVVGPSGKFLDSGVFSSKNFYERSEDNEPESHRSGKSASSDPVADQDSSGLSDHTRQSNSKPQLSETHEAGSHSDSAGKTQPFIPAGDSSETSGNSHGFMPDSQRVNDTNTLTSLNFLANRSESRKAGAGTSSDAVSTLGSKHSQASGSIKSEHTVVQDDEEDYAGDEDEEKRDEDNSLYGSYHHYRALLDKEEEDSDKAEKRNEEEEEGEVVEIVPRSLNNISTVLALQASEATGVPEEISEQANSRLPDVLNTDIHHGNSSFCSGENEDSFFQEVVFRTNNGLPEKGGSKDDEHTRNDLDIAVDQVQSLQLSDVEDWLEKHVVDSNEDDLQHSCPGTYRTGAENKRAQSMLNKEEDVAEVASTGSSLREHHLTTPREAPSRLADHGEQEVRLELNGCQDEVHGDTLRSSTDAGDVWRQDIDDSSDEDTFRQNGAPSDREIDKAAGRLNDMHLDLGSKNDQTSAGNMQCLSKVELENSSNSGESHRSMSSAIGQDGNPASGPADTREPDCSPSGLTMTQNPGFEYPFTLELEDLHPALKPNCGEDRGDVVAADHESSALPSARSVNSQGSCCSDSLDKAGDSCAAKEEHVDIAANLSHEDTNHLSERGENAYVETNIDSTVDSAYVDSDSCHPSSAGINNSSKGAGSVYNFMQDDSGVDQLSRTMSRENSRIKLTNFFMPAEDMEASLRALQSATTEANRGAQVWSLQKLYGPS